MILWESRNIYSYTSQKGLLGILQSKKLWMTNILYLNDSSEFTHTLDLVKAELKVQKKLLSKGIPRGLLTDENVIDKKFIIDEMKYKTYELIERVLDRFHMIWRLKVMYFHFLKKRMTLINGEGTVLKKVDSALSLMFRNCYFS